MARRPIHQLNRRFRAPRFRAIQWYRAARKRMARAGVQPSAGSYLSGHDIGVACVFSIEDCGPATYGHPRYTMHATFDYSR